VYEYINKYNVYTYTCQLYTCVCVCVGTGAHFSVAVTGLHMCIRLCVSLCVYVCARSSFIVTELHVNA